MGILNVGKRERDEVLWCRVFVPPMLWSASQEGNDVLKAHLTFPASSPTPTAQIPTHSLNIYALSQRHSLVTVTSFMTLRKKNHLLHASVDERASSTKTFAHTSDKWKINVATEFSEFVMNAYHQPNKNTKADVMNEIILEISFWSLIRMPGLWI